ncbi:hypothetical protein [Nannocystis punicea]|uniref:Lipoprotein n=1 Tax=Nannocystis punicea TaxID=2995304 RepID=A0ABY7HBY0_9BACT|nr:hypothetical protein [Nannocystis poenicansa]WAS96780.1 hypothetical protein O0S08_11590 [Nannocystis poenicansa]
MSRAALYLLLVVSACTSAETWPLQPLDTSGATSPWQQRCGQVVWSAATEAAVRQFAGGSVSFQEVHGDNFLYRVVTLRGATPEAPVLTIDRKDPPLADGHLRGWRREVTPERVRWRSDDGITRAELESAATARLPEPTRERLLAAADACIDDAVDTPG